MGFKGCVFKGCVFKGFFFLREGVVRVRFFKGVVLKGVLNWCVSKEGAPKGVFLKGGVFSRVFEVFFSKKNEGVFFKRGEGSKGRCFFKGVF